VYSARTPNGFGLSARHVVRKRDNAYYEWKESLGVRSTWFGRLYLRLDSLPSSDLRLVRAKGSGHLRMAIDLLGSGELLVKDQHDRTVAKTASSIVTDRWVRIEWRVDQTTGQVEVHLFNSPDLLTPTASAITDPGQKIGTNTDDVQIGPTRMHSPRYVIWTDNPAVSEVGFLGPA
jgi:hypothetical protein